MYLGLLALIDFVSLGYFRRFKWFAKIFWPLHVLTSSLTMSRFYRAIYYGMVTNFNRWAFFLILLVFTVVSIIGGGVQNDGTFPGDSFSRLEIWSNTIGNSSFAGHYDDQNKDIPSITVSIPSDIMTGDVLRLFMVAKVQREDHILEHTPVDSLRKLYPDTSQAALQLWSIKEYFKVKLDEDSILVPRWFFHYKTHTRQRGYLAYIAISYLNEGLHKVSIYNPNNGIIVSIPFYRDLSRVSNQLLNRDEEESSIDFQPKPFGIRE